MSLLSPDITLALTQLLRGLSSPDNIVRSQAEDQLNNEWVAKRPDFLLMGLVEQIGGAEEHPVGAPSMQTPEPQLTSPTDAILRSGPLPTDGDQDTQGPGFKRI
jgi:hypothetical protein